MTSAIFPSLATKTVVVTGGGSGIGSEIVRGFAAQKARVFFLDIAEADSRALVAELGSNAHFIKCDLMDLAALKAALASVEEQAGPVSVLVNNAANDDRHSFEKVTPAYWEDRMNVNLRHYFFAAQAVLPGMRRAGGGAIINIGSVSWHLALPDLVLYETAKAAIEDMTRATAVDYGGRGIRANAVALGSINTERFDEALRPALDAVHPLGRVGRADEVAAVVAHLLSDDASFVSGVVLPVDGGRSAWGPDPEARKL